MRVLEISDTEEAASFAGHLFARWGAEVLRVESPSRAPVREAADMAWHGGKGRWRCDWRSAAGLDALREAAGEADIVLADLRPRDLDALGFDALGGGGPRARVAITPFGRIGPYRDHEATRTTLLALGGYTHLSGDPGRAPLTMPGAYPHAQAGTLAYTAGLALALRGESAATVDVSVFETLATLHQFTDVMWAGGQVRSRHGNRWENLAPTTMLPCADGWVAMNILQQFWPSFALWIGGGLAEDERLALNAGRMAHRDELEAAVARYFEPRRAVDLFREGQEVWRVPVGYAQSLGQVLEDPQLTGRGFWRPVEGPGRRVLVPGSAFQFAGEQPPEERAPSTPSEGLQAPAWRSARREVPAGDAPPHRPLEGVRVLDFTRIWSGPLATRFLADLGAEVIKVEAPNGRGPASVPPGSPGYFPDGDPGERPYNRQGLTNKFNRNKQSLAVDLKTPEGVEVVRRLVDRSDVLVENFSARAMPSLGLGHEALRERNPRLVYVAMPAFGLGGPYRDYVGLGPSIEPLSGLTALMGYGPDEPRLTAQAITDAASGVTATAAVLTALWRREQTGRGALVDLSQSEAMAAYLAQEVVERQLSGREPERLGNASAYHAPQGVYRCAGDDVWLALSAPSEVTWAALAAVAGRGWDVDPRFSTARERLAHRAALDEAIEAWTCEQERAALVARLLGAGVAAAPVNSAPEWLADPHLLAEGYFATLHAPDVGDYRTDGLPLRFDGHRDYSTWRGAVGLGQDNAAVLRLAGYSDEEAADLAARGIVTDRPTV